MTATLCRDCTALAADIRRRHGPAAVRLGRGLPEGRNSLRAGNFSLGAGKIADSALFSLGLRLGSKRGAGNLSRRRREFLSRRREFLRRAGISSNASISQQLIGLTFYAIIRI